MNTRTRMASEGKVKIKFLWGISIILSIVLTLLINLVLMFVS